MSTNTTFIQTDMFADMTQKLNTMNNNFSQPKCKIESESVFNGMENNVIENIEEVPKKDETQYPYYKSDRNRKLINYYIRYILQQFMCLKK